MAKISAHGQVIGTIDYIANSKRFMSDGCVLINHGTGWKVYGRVKPGVDIVEHFQKRSARHQELINTRPALAAYHAQMTKIALSKRWRLNMALRMMSDDPDGVWSEVCDGYSGNLKLSIDQIVHLCKLYNAAIAENVAANQRVA